MRQICKIWINFRSGVDYMILSAFLYWNDCIVKSLKQTKTTPKDLQKAETTWVNIEILTAVQFPVFSSLLAL